jgi:transglutaminase-like putative cysteine protease
MRNTGPVSEILRQTADLAAYLGGSAIIDTDTPAVRAAHAEIVAEATSIEDAARLVFLFVRDRIRHSLDASDRVAALTAGSVLVHGTGLCYAKSHLATALMRLSGIPTGLCYQRLRDDDRLVLHGLIAVHLNGAWHRLDVRGNKPGLHAEFSLDRERLAYAIDSALGEADLPDLLVDPAPTVVECLRSTADILRAHLPSTLA